MSKLDLEAIKGRLEAAIQMVSDLCHKRREWIMSIPLREGYDPDVVIGASQGDFRKLIASLGDCRKLIERVEELEREEKESRREIREMAAERGIVFPKEDEIPVSSIFTEKLRDLLIEYKFADSMPVAAIYARAMEHVLEIAMESRSEFNQWWAKEK